MKIEKFKDYDVYLINAFRMSHTLKRNLTKLVCVRKEKNPKLKIFISSLFQGKKSWNLKCKFKYGFSITLCKKTKKFFFWFQEEKVFWDFNSIKEINRLRKEINRLLSKEMWMFLMDGL